MTIANPLSPVQMIQHAGRAGKGDLRALETLLRGIIDKDRNESIAAGSALTLSAIKHNGKTILLDTAAGSTVTLPAATGSGAIFRFRVSVLATSNSHVIQVASASDAMQGIIFTGDDTSANAQWFAAVSGTSDTITLNRTTTGSVTLGEWIEVEDIASGLFHVRGFITNSGTAATPFSAAVS